MEGGEWGGLQGLHGGGADAVDRADVDDAGGVGGGSGGFEEGREELGEGEDALEVEGEDFGPGGVGVGFVVCAPGCAGVVDEDV